MRLVLQQAAVVVDERGRPRWVRWKGRQRAVARVLDCWRAAGRWWQGGQPRDYWLVECAPFLVVEVYREAGVWVVSRVAD